MGARRGERFPIASLDYLRSAYGAILPHILSLRDHSVVLAYIELIGDLDGLVQSDWKVVRI